MLKSINNARINIFHLTNKFCAQKLLSQRFLSQSIQQQTDLVEIGTFTDLNNKFQPYPRGQLFIHKIFAYRGIVNWSGDFKIYTKTGGENKTQQQKSFCYHVLIDSDDWVEMNFNQSLTAYLRASGDDEQKVLDTYNGIDVVNHDDILPYAKIQPNIDNEGKRNNKEPPIKNPHYSRIFNNMVAMQEAMEIQDTFQQSTKKFNTKLPHAMFKQITGPIEVGVIPFYLGTNVGRHSWWCLFRIINHAKSALILREKHLERSNMTGHGLFSYIEEEGKLNHIRHLTPSKPATQFGACFEMYATKGNNLWGYFVAENDKGELINLPIPTIPLDADEYVTKTSVHI